MQLVSLQIQEQRMEIDLNQLKIDLNHLKSRQRQLEKFDLTTNSSFCSREELERKNNEVKGEIQEVELKLKEAQLQVDKKQLLKKSSATRPNPRSSTLPKVCLRT